LLARWPDDTRADRLARGLGRRITKGRRPARHGRLLLPPGLALATAVAGGLLAAPASASPAGSQPSALTLSWGSNSNGQLGIGASCISGTGPNCLSLSPVQVRGTGTTPALQPVTRVAGGTAHSLALTAGGQVRAWGDGEQGQLGNGTHVFEENRPVAVVGQNGTGQLGSITAIAAGNTSSLALARTSIGAGGQVWAWGTNIWGQLGDGTSAGPEHCPVNRRPPSPSDVCSTIPVGVAGPGGTGRLSGIIALAAGDNHMVALRSDGTVWSWGLNDLGQLGIGNSTGPGRCKPYSNFNAAACSTTPVEAAGPAGQGVLNHVVAIAAGEDYTIAVRSDGSVWAWGSNAFSTLGQTASWTPQQCNSPFAPVPIPCSTVPVQVAGPGGAGHLTGITAVAANGSPLGLHILALGAGGTVWAWGQNDQGQLGLGQNTGPQQCTTEHVPCSLTPAQVTGQGGQGTLPNVRGIAAGQAHSLAVQQRLNVP